MIIAEILALARIQLDDEEEPYKWSNAELIAYLNDAEREACIRANLIVSYPSSVSITGINNISFISSSKKISKTSGGFLSAGEESEVETFEKDDIIQVSDTSNNNGTYTIVSVTDTEIIVAETLVDESNTSATIETIRTATQIPIVSGVHTYKLHPKILKVKRVKPDSLGYPILQRTVYTMDAQAIIVTVNSIDASWHDSLWYYSSWENDSGNIYAYIEENGYIRLIGTPDESDILWMIVSRLPKREFTALDLKLTPEISSIYHTDLIDWILRWAFRKPDSEVQDIVKSQMYEKIFENKFGKRPTAFQDMKRKRLPHTLRARHRQFGF